MVEMTPAGAEIFVMAPEIGTENGMGIKGETVMMVATNTGTGTGTGTETVTAIVMNLAEAQTGSDLLGETIETIEAPKIRPMSRGRRRANPLLHQPPPLLELRRK